MLTRLHTKTFLAPAAIAAWSCRPMPVVDERLSGYALALAGRYAS
jgi:hypothetical protein